MEEIQLLNGYSPGVQNLNLACEPEYDAPDSRTDYRSRTKPFVALEDTLGRYRGVEQH